MILSLLWVISGCVVNNHNLPKQKSDFYDNNYTKNRKVTKKNRRDLNGFYNSVIHDFRTLAIADSFYDKDLIFYEFSNKKWGIIIDESSVYSIIVGQGKSLLGKYFSQKNDPYFDGAIPANYYGTDKEKRINELLCEMFSYYKKNTIKYLYTYQSDQYNPFDYGLTIIIGLFLLNHYTFEMGQFYVSIYKYSISVLVAIRLNRGVFPLADVFDS